MLTILAIILQVVLAYVIAGYLIAFVPAIYVVVHYLEESKKEAILDATVILFSWPFWVVNLFKTIRDTKEMEEVRKLIKETQELLEEGEEAV